MQIRFFNSLQLFHFLLITYRGLRRRDVAALIDDALRDVIVAVNMIQQPTPHISAS